MSSLAVFKAARGRIVNSLDSIHLSKYPFKSTSSSWYVFYVRNRMKTQTVPYLNAGTDSNFTKNTSEPIQKAKQSQNVNRICWYL
ncbi:predicted protein [Chaetoceros tenuissimus]|uniref:Uncharacterized protein n=1 Tax=Chaetoceros tenuissimus TaxID=426638 RepID=A0AAD3D1U3_9STRA|nr:predicted protein [Chaetoceros tenuissimus]